MPKKRLPSKYSLRGQLLVLAGTTFILCAAVTLMFFPLLNMALESFHTKSTRYIEQAKEAEGTTIARLMVLELSRVKDLLQVGTGPMPEADQNIKNLLWEKVTFNSAIEGIELIQGQENAEKQHVTFLFYRRETLELTPMMGPQRVLKTFVGLEEELINGINLRQKVDQQLLESVNRGPKREGEMMFRYFPVHVLMPEEGAVYWGVAKIGINTAWVRRILAEDKQGQELLRRTIWLEIILSLAVSGILAMSLIYYWVHNLTNPLKNLAAVTVDLRVAQPSEYELWLENLKRVNPQGQGEVAGIQDILLRLGTTVPRLGQRLITGERQACLGRAVSRSLPALQDWRARLQALQQQKTEQDQPSPVVLQEMEELLARLQAQVQDVLRFWPAKDVEWQHFDLAPGLQSAWRLATGGLPAGMQLTLDIQPLPQVWGSPVELPLAVLYLLDLVAEYLKPGGQLDLKASPTPAGGVQIIIEASESRMVAVELQDWLTPWQRYGEVRRHLGPALAAAIASQHGGNLTVQAREKGGVRFSLELPPIATTDASLEPHI